MTAISETFKNNQPSPLPGMTVISGFLVDEDLVVSCVSCPREPQVSPCCVFWAPFIPPGEFFPGKLNQCREIWCCVHTQVFSCQCSLSAIFLNTLLLVFLSSCSVGCCHNNLLPTNRARPHVTVAGMCLPSLHACTLVSVPCCTGFCYIWTVASGFLYFIYLVFIDSLLWTVHWGCFVCS